MFFYNSYSVSLIRFKREFDFVNYKILSEKKITKTIVSLDIGGGVKSGDEFLRCCHQALGEWNINT